MQQDIAALRKQRHRSFMMKGVAFAVASGICYGLYTAFLTWEKPRACGAHGSRAKPGTATPR